MFKPGDRVRNKNTGNAYTVRNVHTVFGEEQLIMQGYPDLPVPASAHEFVESQEISEFKKVLAKVRASGYDVKVTISKTVTEEL